MVAAAAPRRAAVCIGARTGKAMYSLYRSWLSRPDIHHPGVPHGVPLPGALPLADVVVSVGDGTHRYAAHRAVLAAHSGYFKSALDRDPGSSYIAVSSVTPEALVPLLGYMYTGYLDIGGDNIYDVLLAAGYLHMPRAVEWCRNFLLAHQPAALDSPPGSTAPAAAVRSTLVKPIPGLPWRPALCAPPAPPQPPASHMVLSTAEHSPFRAPFLTASPTAAAAANLGSAPKRARSPSPTGGPGSPTKRLSGEDKERTKQATASKSERSSPSAPLSARTPEPASTLSSSAPTTPTPSKASTSASTSSGASTTSTTSTTTSTVTGKVVVDVACCDGPVRFHRVLNTSYGHQAADQGAADAGGANASDENQLHQRMHVPGAAQLRRARRMAERGPHPGATAAGAANEYVCHYCNHAFKSHYCYQKHARRHINPLTPGGAKLEVQAPPAAARAPAKPLDMNVQYYPCKTCGAKFPSYYFVHKHRKLCHSGEEGDAAAGLGPGLGPGREDHDKD